MALSPPPVMCLCAVCRKSDLVPRPSKLAAGEKRKRAVRDVDAKGQLAITISTGVLRSFLNDSSPLLRPRKKLTAAYLRNRQPRDELDVVSPSAAVGLAILGMRDVGGGGGGMAVTVPTLAGW